MVIDVFWDQVGIRCAKSMIVFVILVDMVVVSDEMDYGMGVVWVGDN